MSHTHFTQGHARWSLAIIARNNFSFAIYPPRSSEPKDFLQFVGNDMAGIFRLYHSDANGVPFGVPIASTSLDGPASPNMRLTAPTLLSNTVPLRVFLEDCSSIYPHRVVYSMRTKYGASKWVGIRYQQPSEPENLTMTSSWERPPFGAPILKGYDTGDRGDKWPFEWRALAIYRDRKLVRLFIEAKTSFGTVDRQAFDNLAYACLLASWMIMPVYYQPGLQSS